MSEMKDQRVWTPSHTWALLFLGVSGLIFLAVITLWAMAIITGSGTLAGLGSLGLIPLVLTGVSGGIFAAMAEASVEEIRDELKALRKDRMIQDATKSKEVAEAARDYAIKELHAFRERCICKDLNKKEAQNG